MSGVNFTCSIGNQLSNGSGETKFDVSSKDASSLAASIAKEIVNEILESALDLATLRNAQGFECDTIAFSVDDDLCRISGFDEKENLLNAAQLLQEHADIKEMIDDMSSIRVPEQNADKSILFDIEMKRFLTEMMSPPYDIVNYETLMRKDGVGDQPIDEFAASDEGRASQAEECLVDPEQTKIVEKKTRVTDLVMNSKQVLSEYLMSEESRKKQEEWEVSNEEVIQIIELAEGEPIGEESEEVITEPKCRVDEHEEAEESALISGDENMETIELSSMSKEIGNEKTIPDKQNGNGYDSIISKPGSSHSQATALAADTKNVKCRSKFELFMKKKWSINLKFLGIGKKKRSLKKEEKTTM